MATVNRFEELDCWKMAREICAELGKLIDAEKFVKCYRLIHQIEGSSGSIMDNIAEGFERGSRMEFILFLGYAKGSCGELRSQLYRSLDRRFIEQEEFDRLRNLAEHISSSVHKLITYLQKTTVEGTRRKIVAKEH